MSSKSISTYFLVAALLYAAANPLANAFFFQQFARITGRVCCTTMGTCAAGSVGIPTTPVTLNCPTVGTVATTTTDAIGGYLFFVTLPPTVVPTTCTVTFALPLNGLALTTCSAAPAVVPTGTRTAPVTGTFINDGGFFPFPIFPFPTQQRIFTGTATAFN